MNLSKKKNYIVGRRSSVRAAICQPIAAALTMVLALCTNVHATTVTYTLDDLGSNNFSANFTVVNDSLTVPIEEFSIFLPVGDFEMISIISSPTDWDGLAVQPDAGLPDDGFVDWLALGAPIGIGETLSGFTAAFTFLGVGSPESFLFDVIDPFTFDVLFFWK